MPPHGLIEAHVLTVESLHGDDTTVPILVKGKTDTGRIWPFVRDDRPFVGQSPPARRYYASRDRRQEHPERHLKIFTDVLQADGYGGYNPLFKVDGDPGPPTQALCWAHSRRKFFVLADIATNAKRGKNVAAISASTRCSTSSATSTDFWPTTDCNDVSRMAVRSLLSVRSGFDLNEQLSHNSPVAEAIVSATKIPPFLCD